MVLFLASSDRPLFGALSIEFDPIDYIQARGALKKELLEHLRRTRVMRRSRHHTQKTDDHGRIIDAVSISERPATVEDRAVPGH